MHSDQVLLRNTSSGYQNRNWYEQLVELHIWFATTRSGLLLIRRMGVVVGGRHGGTDAAVDNLNCLDEERLIYTQSVCLEVRLRGPTG